MSVWFALRMLAGATIAAYGAQKLLGSRRPPMRGRLGRITDGRLVIAALGTTEIMLAAMWTTNPLPALSATTALATGAVITAVGIGNIHRTGTCGCGGRASHTPAQLVRRNTVLFGVVAIAAVLGPDAVELGGSGAAQLEAVLLTPAAIVILVAVSAIAALR